MSEDPPPPPELRASDGEREQAVEALRQAVAEGRLTIDELAQRTQSAYTVPTRRELEGLLADVTIAPNLGALTRPDSDAHVAPDPGTRGTARVVSIMGGHDYGGKWRIAPRCTVINVMGGTDLDLCDAELSGAVTELRVISLMGGSEIRVPECIEVHVSQFALMGGNDVKLGDQPPSGGPQIRIRLVSIMGGTSVRRGRRPTKAERRRERELRKAERRGELKP